MKYFSFENKYFKKNIKNQIFFKDWCLPKEIEYEQIDKLSKKRYFDYKFSFTTFFTLVIGVCFYEQEEDNVSISACY